MAPMHVSVAPLTLVQRSNGTTQYVYLHQVAPTDALPGDLDRLVAEGYLARVETPDTLVQPSVVSMPAKSAPKADWVAWAVSQGASEETAKAAKKEELVGSYGSDQPPAVAPVADPDALTEPA